MNSNGPGKSSAASQPRIDMRTGVDLFLIGVVSLFLELACIRWFSAHVLFLTFFTNCVLLACFLGLALGCLLADWPRAYIFWTPALLLIAFLSAHAFFYLLHEAAVVLDAGNNDPSADNIFFGTEYFNVDLARFVVPVEVVAGFFFLLLALSFLGIGQELGRALKASPAGITAYTINTLGGLAGVAAFSLCAWMRSSPFWWFLFGCAGLAYLLLRRTQLSGWNLRRAVALALLPGILLLASVDGDKSASGAGGRTYITRPGLQLLSLFQPQAPNEESVHCLWSPYYRIDYAPHGARNIWVNLITHQQMVSRDSRYPVYALPHLLNRDVGGAAFQDVLIIGAGSGNDVSRALQWGAGHVDAVEIDPVIQALGQRDHPDHPYQDDRVSVHLDDGRNFLRTSERQYDLIVYALVDSLVLHSGYSNIRLESYLFTQEAFADVRRHLKPGGVFVVYNLFRQGWVVARLSESLTQVFEADPVVLNLPHRETIRAEERGHGLTMLFAGATDRLRGAFLQHPAYWLRNDRAPSRETANGFVQQPSSEDARIWTRYAPATVVGPQPGPRPATDDWPFLYLHHPMIPELSVNGMLVMGGLSLALLLLFTPGRHGPDRDFYFQGHMFCLGAGFMLIETRAVVVMALLFGSTWAVNSVVLSGVLAMILASNAVALWMSPGRLWVGYVGVVSALSLAVLVPSDVFLGVAAFPRLAGSILLVFAPILFAGVIFALSLRQTVALHQAFGANIAGAVFGGLAEYNSMLIGFRRLLLVAACFYAGSAVFVALSRRYRQTAIALCKTSP